jgi:hypothetical protein
MIKFWREITDFCLCPKYKNQIFVSCEKIFRCGGNVCRSVIVLFLLATVLPALALGDLKTLLALFLKQKRVRTFTWLDPIQWKKNTCTIFNQVQFNLKTRVQFYVIRQQMKLKKTRVQFYVIRHQMKLTKTTYMQFYIAIADIGPYRLWSLPVTVK